MSQRVSDKPMLAPADYQRWERNTGSLEELGYTKSGPGWPTELTCAECGNAEGNLEIYESWSVSAHSGDAFESHEIRCARCGKFSLYRFER